MSFPAKHRNLLELTLKDLETPDYAWLTYAVCALTNESCGWGGWIIESAFKMTVERHPTGTGDEPMPTADGAQICPRCGRTLFRTNASIRMVPSEDQMPVCGEAGTDYEAAEMDYDE